MSTIKDGEWCPTTDKSTYFMSVPGGYIVRYISLTGDCSLVFIPNVLPLDWCDGDEGLDLWLSKLKEV
jgi:hypothetical protein